MHELCDLPPYKEIISKDHILQFIIIKFTQIFIKTKGL